MKYKEIWVWLKVILVNLISQFNNILINKSWLKIKKESYTNLVKYG